MNRYGAQALRHWRQSRPQDLAALPDPQRYFTQLGMDVEQAIQTLERELAGPAPAQETYLQRLQRLNMARVTAEGQILRQMVLLEQPASPEP